MRRIFAGKGLLQGSLDPSHVLLFPLSSVRQGYYELERMHAEGELVSLASLNCVLAGCAFLRDIGRAVLTFQEVEQTFGLNPDVHSFNALILAHSWTGEVRDVRRL